MKRLLCLLVYPRLLILFNEIKISNLALQAIGLTILAFVL